MWLAVQKRNHRLQNRKEEMAKYKCTIDDVDMEHINQFNLTFDAENESDAESQAMIEVKQNLQDYIVINAEKKD